MVFSPQFHLNLDFQIVWNMKMNGKSFTVRFICYEYLPISAVKWLNKEKDFHLSLDKVKWKVKVNYQVQRPWCALELGEETSVPSSILSFWKDNERKEQYPNPHLRKFLLQEFLIFSLFTCLPECNKWEGESLACFNL